MLDIVSRGDWGARLPRAVSPLDIPTRDLILHHDGGGSTEGAARVRAIQDYHMDSKGWRDIAYHYLIEDDGVIFEGRGGGIEGGATLGENDTSHAICLLGDFDTETPTDAALDSLVALIRWGHERGWWPDRLTGGHRDFRPTSCPGDNLYARIPEINQQIGDTMPAPKDWDSEDLNAVGNAVLTRFAIRDIDGNFVVVKDAIQSIYQNTHWTKAKLAGLVAGSASAGAIAVEIGQRLIDGG